MDPKTLIAEAEAAERLARTVVDDPDRNWLQAKARALRHEAERVRQRERDRPRRA